MAQRDPAFLSRDRAGFVVGWLAVPVVIGVAVFGVWPMASIWPLTSTCAVLTSAVWMITAAVLAPERAQRGNAMLFGAVGLGWGVEWLDNRDYGPFPFAAYLAGPLYLVCGAVAVLRYPNRRLRPGEKAVVAALAATLPVGRLGMALSSEAGRFDYSPRAWWPTVRTDDAVYYGLSTAYWACASVLAIAFLTLLVRRIRRAAHLDRWMITPLLVALAVMVGVLTIRITWRLAVPSATTPQFLVGAQTLGLLLVPVSFLVSALRRRTARIGVADLVSRVSEPFTEDELRSALRRALRDPTLEIYYLLPDRDDRVDATGRVVAAQRPASGRAVRTVRAASGEPLAVVEVDEALVAHAELLDGALNASRLALENARLAATVRAQLEEIRLAGQKVIEAGDSERRRLERDLHDGVQQRLLALILRLGEAAGRDDLQASAAILDQARVQLRASLEELRELAHGIHPAVVTSGGLQPALHDLAERMPFVVGVEVPPQRWPQAVEITAYFVVAEALANVMKHSNASRVEVLVHAEDGRLHVVVDDDGVGGASVRAGTGLVGLRARVEALGGDLDLTSGRGTRLVATIPFGGYPT